MKVVRENLLKLLLLQFIIFIYVGTFQRQSYHTNSVASVATHKPQKVYAQVTPPKKELSFNELLTQVQVITKTTIPPKIVQTIQKEPHPKPHKITQHIVKKPIKKVQKPKSISKRTKLVKYAKAKLGDKYVWGATGPKTFDCSGFTKEVFSATVGIKIPRVSRDQAKVGKYIKYEELKAGDMVFFDTEKHYSGKVNHVGIYLANGEFIHASSARKKVIITNFKKKPFYKKRFLWGRRVITTPS